MRLNIIVFILISAFLFFSCSSDFLIKNDVKYLKDYENKEYILKEDTGEGNRLIKKGERVKLYIITEDEYIKVYCYPSKTDFLKAERTLLLYLFKDDFEKEKFDSLLFEEKLFAKIEIPKAAEIKKK